MGIDPPSCSWTISPRIPIMAARPLFNSIARLESLVSASNLSQPKSSAPLRKSPTNSPSPVTSFMTKSSRKPTKATICPRPAPEIASGPEMAAHPLGKESKEFPA
ncbi:hypothetical protein ACHAXS_006488 [Conticribra weissflogii]